MSDSPMIYSIHTIYNGGLGDGVEHYISAQSRLEGLRARIVDLGERTAESLAALGEDELSAVMAEILAPTNGRISLTEAPMSDVPPEPARLKQLFVLDTQDYDSFTGLYRDTEALLAGLVEKIFAEGETFFSAETKTEVQAVITRDRNGITPVDQIHDAVLTEIRDVLEDGPYAVWVNDVALPA